MVGLAVLILFNQHMPESIRKLVAGASAFCHIWLCLYALVRTRQDSRVLKEWQHVPFPKYFSALFWGVMFVGIFSAIVISVFLTQ